MADPLSVTSGVITLVLFACQSSRLLYQTISSFQSSQRNVRELKEELEALDGVLQALQKTAAENHTDLAALELPLFRCGTACRDFEGVIVKCTAHSDRPRTSFRDWAKLKYMGDDIVGFKNMVAGYKSTIIIALGDANMRTSVVTRNFLEEFKQIITNTTSDLSQHLEDIDARLQTLQSGSISDDYAIERSRIQEERESAQHCLLLCTQVYEHISQALPTSSEDPSKSLNAYTNPGHRHNGPPSATIATSKSFNTCRETITKTTNWLEKHLLNMDEQLKSLSIGDPGLTERNNLEQEMESAKQCLAICSQASQQAEQERINIFEDISMADDGQQVIVSTVGDLISAKRVTAGARSLQMMGQMSDESVQHVSREHSSSVAAESKQALVGRPGAKFNDRYGKGVTLNSQGS